MPVVSKIKPLYKGAHAIVAAPGPSLTESVVDQIYKIKDRYAIIGVGDAYKQIPFLDELYACDGRWWKVHGQKVKSLYPNLSTWCYDDEGLEYGAKKVGGEHKDGFSTDPKYIHFGSNSGYQTLNLAYHLGIKKMLLVGFNMQKVNGKSHFFTNRERSLDTNSPYNQFVQKYNTIQPEIKKMIINCTPNSALTAFEKKDLKDFL